MHYTITKYMRLCTIDNVNRRNFFIDAKKQTYFEYLSCEMRLLNVISEVRMYMQYKIHT